MAILKGNTSDDLTLKYLLENSKGGGGSEEIQQILDLLGETALPTTDQTITGAIAELDADIDGKVSKSGDTMTGNLETKKASLIAKSTNVTDGTGVGATTYANARVFLNDSDGNNIGVFSSTFYADSRQSVSMRSRRKINGANVDNYIELGSDSSGNRHVALNAPAEWRDALGVKDPYPVGSIYISTNSTSPASLFGGTWARITGKFLLAATDGGAQGGNSNASIAAGYTGGEATHTLTTDEIPSHSHRDNIWNSGSQVSSSANCVNWSRHGNDNITGAATGGGQAHNNMPPYLAVYVWERTA